MRSSSRRGVCLTVLVLGPCRAHRLKVVALLSASGEVGRPSETVFDGWADVHARLHVSVGRKQAEIARTDVSTRFLGQCCGEALTFDPMAHGFS